MKLFRLRSQGLVSGPGLALATVALWALIGPQAASACTPAPCIEASPNPVNLGAGETQGSTTLDWDAGADIAQATVTVDVNGQETLLSSQLVGQQLVTIGLGTVYLFRLRDNSNAVLASVQVEASRRVTAGRAPSRQIGPLPSRPTPSRVSPIKTLFAIHGTFVGINAWVPTPRNITAFITRNQPSGCETEGLDIVAVGAQGTTNYQTAHHLKLYNLDAGTNYFWLIKMTDASGQTECRDGTLRTRSRTSTITVKSVHVFDDSDDLSAGDLTFGFFVNPTPEQRLGSHRARFPSEGETSINSGTGVDFNPDVTLVVPDLEELHFNVTGSDDDELTSPGVLPECGQLMVPLDDPSSDDCGDRDGKTTFLYLGPVSLGDEEISRDFKVRVVGGALEFEVDCHLAVTYQ